MSKSTNPAEQFQKEIAAIVTDAAKNDVHPAIVYTVLAGIAQDVLYSIKRGAQIAEQVAAAKTAETILMKPKTNEPNNVTKLHLPGPVDGPGNNRTK